MFQKWVIAEVENLAADKPFLLRAGKFDSRYLERSYQLWTWGPIRRRKWLKVTEYTFPGQDRAMICKNCPYPVSIRRNSALEPGILSNSGEIVSEKEIIRLRQRWLWPYGLVSLRILLANTHLRRIWPPDREIRESGERLPVFDHHDQLFGLVSISFLSEPDRHGKQWIKHTSNHVCVLLRY
jgi:hypothetical protein